MVQIISKISVVQFITMMYNHGLSTDNVLLFLMLSLFRQGFTHRAESGSFSPKLCVKYKIRHWVTVTWHEIRQAGHGKISGMGIRESERG